MREVWVVARALAANADVLAGLRPRQGHTAVDVAIVAIEQAVVVDVGILAVDQTVAVEVAPVASRMT